MMTLKPSYRSSDVGSDLASTHMIVANTKASATIEFARDGARFRILLIRAFRLIDRHM